MFHTSQIEISRGALKNNVDFVKRVIGPDTEFCSVVKGNAYGHGIKLFVPLAESIGVKSFAVFSADEALEVLNHRTRPSGIMIMGDISLEQLEWAVEHEIDFYVFENQRLNTALEAAQKIGKPARIHLQLETGMFRTGLEVKELKDAARLINRNRDQFVLRGVATHYAGAESSSNYLRIRQQIETYRQRCEWLREQGLVPELYHTASSAATVTYPDSRMNLARVGIMQYGYWPSPETRMYYFLHYPQNGEKPAGDKDKPMPKSIRKLPDPLIRIIRWTSRVMSVKSIPPGEFVGYGTTYLTTRRLRIATVPIGYFHGYTRGLSNLGRVLIHGRRVTVVGTVNMNMIMVDITDVPGVKPGDEVVLIGKQKKMEISVGSFAERTPFLNYEVLVRLPSEIPRKVVE